MRLRVEAIYQDRATGGQEQPGDAVEQGCLAGTIRALSTVIKPGASSKETSSMALKP